MIFISSYGKEQITEDENNAVNDENILTEICIQACKDSINRGVNLEKEEQIDLLRLLRIAKL